MATTTSSMWHKISKNWNQFSGEVRRRWGLLTEDDLEAIYGDRDVLVSRLQDRYGYSMEDAHNKIEAWENSLA